MSYLDMLELYADLDMDKSYNEICDYLEEYEVFTHTNIYTHILIDSDLHCIAYYINHRWI